MCWKKTWSWSIQSIQVNLLPFSKKWNNINQEAEESNDSRRRNRCRYESKSLIPTENTTSNEEKFTMLEYISRFKGFLSYFYTGRESRVRPAVHVPFSSCRSQLVIDCKGRVYLPFGSDSGIDSGGGWTHPVYKRMKLMKSHGVWTREKTDNAECYTRGEKKICKENNNHHNSQRREREREIK